MTITNAPLVAIITLNWNHAYETIAFLESCSTLAYPSLLLIVVDNDSTDYSVVQIKARFPAIDLLVNHTNLGFAGGMNVGIKHALDHNAEFVLLANNDTILAPDMLLYLVEAAQANHADIATPIIYYADQPDRIWWTGGWRRWPTLEITPCDRDPAHVPTRPFAVDFVTGCGMLLRRRCIERVGLLDERFFMYYEDADYCLRAQQAGCVLLVAPQAHMWHMVATSLGGSDSVGERYHIARSSVQFFRKHIRGWAWLLVGPYRAASGARTLLRLLVANRRAAALAHVQGLWDGWWA